MRTAEKKLWMYAVYTEWSEEPEFHLLECEDMSSVGGTHSAFVRVEANPVVITHSLDENVKLPTKAEAFISVLQAQKKLVAAEYQKRVTELDNMIQKHLALPNEVKSATEVESDDFSF